MENNLTCSQVIALLSLYVNNRVSPQVNNFITNHIKNCPSCREKYEAFKRISLEMKNGVNDAVEKVTAMHIPEEKKSEYSKTFSADLSAYIDNELSDEENFKIKKYIISNQNIRKELEQFYALKNALNLSFEKSKNEIKDDFSNYVLVRMNIHDEINKNESFLKVAGIITVFIGFFAVSAVMLIIG